MKKTTIIGIAISAFLFMAGCRDGNRRVTRHETDDAIRHWWICGGVKMTTVEVAGDTKALGIGLGIGFLPGYGADAGNKAYWETRAGEQCELFEVGMIFTPASSPWAFQDIDEDTVKHLSLCQVVVVGRGKTYSDILSSALRYKGETNWFCLSDYISLDETTREFALKLCGLCNAPLPKQAASCPRCTALLQLEKKN